MTFNINTKSKKVKHIQAPSQTDAILNYLFEIKQKLDYLCHLHTMSSAFNRTQEEEESEISCSFLYQFD